MKPFSKITVPIGTFLLITGCSQPKQEKANPEQALTNTTTTESAKTQPTPEESLSPLTGVPLPHTFTDSDIEVTIVGLNVTPYGTTDFWLMFDVDLVNKWGREPHTVDWKPYIAATSVKGYSLENPSAMTPTNDASGKIAPNQQQRWKIAFKASRDQFPVTVTFQDRSTLTVTDPDKIKRPT